MRVLILTKIFPNSAEPLSSPFNRLQFGALSRLCKVEVLATIPWFPGARAFSRWSRAGRLVGVPATEDVDGLVVHHPRFVFVPRIGPGLSGPLYAASLARVALRYQGLVDVVLGSWAYPDGFAAVVLAELLGVPAVVKLHGSDMNVVARMSGPSRLLSWALPRAERVVAVSRQLRDAAIGLGAAPDRVDVVPNGVDRARFHPQSRELARRTLGLRPTGSVILYVGNMEAHKGVLDLVLAFATLSRGRDDITLLMIGDGDGITECRELSRLLGAPVRILGSRPHGEIPEWLAACNILALPSWNEGTPNVVLEALASGRRVVATSVGGTPDVVSSPLLGALVPPRAPEALARALELAVATPYDPSAVSDALDVLDWSGSARRLHGSLVSALEQRTREAA